MSSYSNYSIVTGASGFLGHHLVRTLLRESPETFVIGLDNFSTGRPENITDLKAEFSESQFAFFETDVSSKWDHLLEASNLPHLRNRKLQYVFHFASPASPPLYQKLALETLWVNSLGLNHCLQYADSRGGRVIFASTSEIYGDPLVHPQPETYWGNVNTLGPRACYDEAKRFGEALLSTHNRVKKTHHGLVRIFNTYGPGMNPEDGRVIINFLTQALRGEDLTVYGSGLQTRSFCYVSDLIDGILKYAESSITEPVNLGNPTEFTILDLAQAVSKIFAKDINFEMQSEALDDPKKRKPDISKARKLLSWEPRVPLQEGLARTLAWLKGLPRI